MRVVPMALGPIALPKNKYTCFNSSILNCIAINRFSWFNNLIISFPSDVIFKMNEASSMSLVTKWTS